MPDFASIEARLQIVLATVAKVSLETARAVFSGVRSDQTRSYIIRALKSHGENEGPYLKRALDQIGVITTARNDIVHYGATFGTEEFTVSNALLAMPGAEYDRPVSAPILQLMRKDLNTAHFGLMAFLWKYSNEDACPFADAALEAWLYKPQLPAPSRRVPKGTRDKDTKHSPPRRS